MLYTKIEHPWRMVERCEMFQAMLSRNIPLNLSVLITRTLQAVLITCSQSEWWWQRRLPAYFLHLELDFGGWTMSLCPYSCLCHSSRVVFLLSHKVKLASELYSSIWSQGGKYFLTSATECQNVRAGILNVTWIRSWNFCLWVCHLDAHGLCFHLNQSENINLL